MSYTEQLIYIPLDKGSVGIDLGGGSLSAWLETFSVQLGLTYTGERFILDDNSKSLPSHVTIDGSVSSRVPLPGGSISLNYSAVNLAGTDYQVMPGYPMPLFNQSLTITYMINF